jgi:hypothetical protein
MTGGESADRKGLTGNDAVMIQKYLLKLICSLDPSE